VPIAGSNVSQDSYDNPVCVNEEGTYLGAAVSVSYYGPDVMPPVMHWSAPAGITNFNTTSTVTSGNVYRFTFLARVNPLPPKRVPYTVYFQPPSSVVVPGTIQATNAPDYNYSHAIDLRPTVFIRECILRILMLVVSYIQYWLRSPEFVTFGKKRHQRSHLEFHLVLKLEV